jgi:hypothetical protein
MAHSLRSLVFQRVPHSKQPTHPTNRLTDTKGNQRTPRGSPSMQRWSLVFGLYSQLIEDVEMTKEFCKGGTRGAPLKIKPGGVPAYFAVEATVSFVGFSVFAASFSGCP